MRKRLRLYVHCVLTAATVGCCLAIAPCAMAEGDNAIFQDLLQRGVPFGGNFRKLRTPTLADGLTAAQQQQAIGPILQLKPGAKPTYAEFTKNNVNAKYVLLIDDLTPPFGGANQPGHSIDLWFVVWGDLSKIVAPTFLKQQFQPDPNDHIDVLKSADLPMGIQPQQIPGGGDYFVHGQFVIFSGNPTIRLDATAHAIETISKESGTVAAIVDPQFNGSPKFPNEWRPILRGANGGVVIGAKGQPEVGLPSLYISAGGYLKTTALLDPKGALLVEYHLVYDEPPGWFGGKNFLRSKLYTKTEDDVRSFRRKVTAASKEKQKEASEPKK